MKTSFNELSPALARRLAEKLCDRYGVEDRSALFCGRIVSTIKTGASRDHDSDLYLWACSQTWLVRYWPQAGGAEAFVKVDGMGWCLDAYDDMPHDVWVSLLEAVGAPLDRMIAA